MKKYKDYVRVYNKIIFGAPRHLREMVDDLNYNANKGNCYFGYDLYEDYASSFERGFTEFLIYSYAKDYKDMEVYDITELIKKHSDLFCAVTIDEIRTYLGDEACCFQSYLEKKRRKENVS